MRRWAWFGSSEPDDENGGPPDIEQPPALDRTMLAEVTRRQRASIDELDELKEFLRERARAVADREAELVEERRRVDQEAERMQRRREAIRNDRRRRVHVLARLEQRHARQELDRRARELDERERAVEERERALEERLAALAPKSATS